MTKDEALKLALEALETKGEHHPRVYQAITAIKQVLANDALEKKAENAKELGLDYEPNKNEFNPDWDEKLALTEEVIRLSKRIEELEAQPEQEPWPDEPVGHIAGGVHQPQRKPLSDEEIEDIWADCPADWDDKINVLTLARAIEAAHGIKGEA